MIFFEFKPCSPVALLGLEMYLHSFVEYSRHIISGCHPLAPQGYRAAGLTFTFF